MLEKISIVWCRIEAASLKKLSNTVASIKDEHLTCVTIWGIASEPCHFLI
jgi:hypothetical protein